MSARTQPTAEAFFPTAPPQRVDREKHRVYGVRILGPVSANGRVYPAAVMEKAAPKYEGAAGYVDAGVHQQVTTSQPTTAKFCVFENVRVENGGLHADASYNPKHEFADAFLWACESNPSFYGFSHRAHVVWKPGRDGTETAESISHVYGVDIVSDPATTRGVFEAKGTASMDPLDPRMAAQQFTSPDALTQFLAALFDALPSGTWTPDAKQAVLDALSAKAAGGAASDQAAPTAAGNPAEWGNAVEALRAPRFGKLGGWAAGVIERYAAESRKAERLAKAAALCDEKKLPAHLRGDRLLGLVAESIDDPAKAAGIVDEILAIGRPSPAAADPNAGRPVTTKPATSGPPKSAKDLVAELL